MSETIWRATDADGDCFDYHDDKPIWDGDTYGIGYGNNWNRYHGANQPPPGECWEIVQTRKGEQPTGEAWERLLNVVADYTRNVGIVGPRGEKIKEAWKAYESAQSAKPPASPTEVSAADQVKILEGMLEDVKAERDRTIAELRSELDETRTERHAYKSRLREFCQRLVDMVGAEGPEDVEGMLDKVNAEIQRLKQSIDSLNASLADKEGFLNSAGDEIQRLMEDRDEAVVELRSLSTYSGQVIAERDAAIAEPQEQIRKLKIESATQTDAVSERDDRIDRLSHDLGLMTKEWNELQAKLDKPEMPECVRSLIGDIIREVPGRFSQAIAAVEAHYAPPFKFEVGGVYEASDNGNRWIVRHVWPSGEFIATYDGPLISSVTFHKNGQAISAAWSLVNRLR